VDSQPKHITLPRNALSIFLNLKLFFVFWELTPRTHVILIYVFFGEMISPKPPHQRFLQTLFAKIAILWVCKGAQLPCWWV